eukprot:TRINITY_DN2536_c0_g1_i3.p1 TRINITY_DN2536_c0_g1~~TRINITY_DN2536_c0_g1_i3.p1  ORF type:complete len:706 (+),score=253.98 TRINITY_DN2536_c0_g1_i3:65-2182(+)
MNDLEKQTKEQNLQEENAHLRNLLLQVTKENMHLISELDEIKKTKTNSMNIEQIHNLQLMINGLEEEIDDLRKKYHEEQVRKNKMHKQNLKLRDTINEMEGNQLILKQRYVDSLNKIADLTKDRERLRDRAKIASDQIGNLNSKYEKVKWELENSNSIIEANTVRFQREIKTLERDLKSSKSNSLKYQKTLDSVFNETNDWNEKNKTLKLELSRLQGEFERMEINLLEKEEENKELRLEMDERIEFAVEDRCLAMESSIRSRDLRIIELEKMNNVNNSKLLEYEDVIADLQGRVEEKLIEENEVLLKRNQNLQDSFDEVKGLNLQLFDKTVELNEQIKDLEIKHFQIEKEKRNLEECVKQFRNSAEKNEDVEQLKKNTELQLFQNEKNKIVNDYEKKIIEFKNKIKLKDNEKQLLEKENDELKKQAKKNVEEKSENFLMMNELQLKISKTLTTSNTLNDIIKERTEENLLLKEENMKMQAKINSLILENENFKREKHLYVSNVEDFNSKKEKDLIENSKLLEKLENAGKKEFDSFKEKEQMKTQLCEKLNKIAELEGINKNLREDLDNLTLSHSSKMKYLEQNLLIKSEENTLLQNEVLELRENLGEFTKSSAELQEFNEQLVENKEISEAVVNKAKKYLNSAAKKMKDDKAQIGALKKQLTKDRMKFAEILASKDILLDYYKSLCEEEEEESEKEEVIETEKEN